MADSKTMTPLEVFRERCAMSCVNLASLEGPGCCAECLETAAVTIRAIPLPEPAPVDDEFAGHTPEPWVADKQGVIRAGPMVTYARGTVQRQLAMVMHVDLDNEETTTQLDGRRDASARLMAAAPRLLRERDEARAKQNEVMSCGHHASNRDRSVESGASFCAACRNVEMLRDALTMEECYRSERDEARAEVAALKVELAKRGGAPC